MRNRQAVDYDQVAGEYAAHRGIHPGVFCQLCAQSGLDPGSRVLEVGCGTGNYITALADTFGCAAFGLDPSIAMLARIRSERVQGLQGAAQALSLAAGTFDLIFSIDVIHHVGDRAAFYRGAARALRPGGLICTVTDSEEMIRRREILSGYFPETVEIELARYPRIAQLEAWSGTAGLEALGVVAVEEPYEITCAGPFRDRAYSSLHLIPAEAWRTGLERLEWDLVRGPVGGTARYACVWARKPEA